MISTRTSIDGAGLMMTSRIDGSAAGGDVSLPSAPRRRGALTLRTIGPVGAVLVALHALSGAIVTSDGRLVGPFGALALGTVLLTVAGLTALARMFGGVRRSSTCGRGGC
jgi:hypothetical protein